MKNARIDKWIGAGAVWGLFALMQVTSMHAQDGRNGTESPDYDLKQFFEAQMEDFSRLLPDDPSAREQFRKGIEEMRKAFENDAANPPEPGKPRTYEFHWEGDAGDLGQLKMEFDRMGDFFGDSLFDRFFGGGSNPFERRNPFDGFGPFGGLDPFNGSPRLGPREFDFREWFDRHEAHVPELSKNHAHELKKFRTVVEQARKSTLRILSGGRLVALGTIVTHDGYAVTKGSELGRSQEFEAELADGRTVAARVVDTVPDYDLAVLKLNASGLTPATFSQKQLPVGSFLAAVDITEDPAAVGVLSVLSRNLSPKSKGYLGIELGSDNGQIIVSKVTSDSAAAAAGIRSNDIITAVDGEEVTSRAQLIKAISGREPDSIVEIDYVRNGRKAKTSARLKSRAELMRQIQRRGINPDRNAYDPTNRMGADLNHQRGGYPNALQHDLPLDARQMGGPLVDLDGDIVGINIARAGRVSTYALPTGDLNAIIADLNLAGDPAEVPNDKRPTRNDQALREEVERAEKAIEKARRALKDAEERARSAREALQIR